MDTTHSGLAAIHSARQTAAMFNVDLYYSGLFLNDWLCDLCLCARGLRSLSFSLGPSMEDSEVCGVVQPWFLFYSEPPELLIQATGL